MSAKKLRFDQLKTILSERAGQDGYPSRNSIPNCSSALNSFLRERGYGLRNEVSQILRSRFREERDAHVRQLKEENRPAAYIHNRIHLLEIWRRLVLQIDHDAAAVDGVVTPLMAALRGLFADGRKIKRTARETGIPLASLRRWLDGQVPQLGKISYLERLERYCALSRGELTSLLPYRVRGAKGLLDHEPKPEIAFRQQLKVLQKDEFRLKPHAPDGHPLAVPMQVRAECGELLGYKTRGGVAAGASPSDITNAVDAALGDNDDDRGQSWSLRPPLIGMDAGWVATTAAGFYCPSAEMTASLIFGFLGWCTLPKDRGGKAMSLSDLSLGLVADANLVADYVKWSVERRGKVTSTVTAFLTKVSMLCHPRTGFLPRNSSIGKRLGFGAEEWRQRCVECHARIARIRKGLAKLVTKSRDPAEALAPQLDLKIPLHGFLDGARRLDAEVFTDIKGQIRQARDSALFWLVAANPLRAWNLKDLRWREDNTGDLRQDEKGKWRIGLNRVRFKNRNRGWAKTHDYDTPVDPRAWPAIERWLFNYRPLVGTKTDLVFVSTANPNAAWRSANNRFRVLVRRYVTGSPGVGPQAVRNVVATSIIVKTRGDYGHAAKVLHNNPATVAGHYDALIARVREHEHAPITEALYNDTAEDEPTVLVP